MSTIITIILMFKSGNSNNNMLEVCFLWAYFYGLFFPQSFLLVYLISISWMMNNICKNYGRSGWPCFSLVKVFPVLWCAACVNAEHYTPVRAELTLSWIAVCISLRLPLIYPNPQTVALRKFSMGLPSWWGLESNFCLSSMGRLPKHPLWFSRALCLIS